MLCELLQQTGWQVELIPIDDIDHRVEIADFASLVLTIEFLQCERRDGQQLSIFRVALEKRVGHIECLG
ncbi:MAG: hypothetical protein RLZ79_1437 [Pseudomonadota bacterium]